MAKKNIKLTAEEQEIVNKAKNIEPVNCEDKEANYIFDKFAPVGDVTGMIFSTEYVPLVRGFFSKKYYLLKMKCGSTDLPKARSVTEWCDHILKFKNKEDFENYCAYWRLVIKSQNNVRITMQ